MAREFFLSLGADVTGNTACPGVNSVMENPQSIWIVVRPSVLNIPENGSRIR
jgi:hypothetical protein